MASRRLEHDAQQALADLCQAYWFPVYAYVRRRTPDLHEAQDLTQEFFTRLVERNTLSTARQEGGRFRNFLLATLQNFLTNEWKRARAAKRGGKRSHLSLDLDSAEARYALEPSHSMTAERLFEQQWVLTLLARVLQRLEAEAKHGRKAEQFRTLKPFLQGQADTGDYGQAAVKLGTTEVAVRQLVHRLRKQYRAILRDEVSQTVADASEIDQELRRLFECITAK
jgi:RNA polymerase sigma factor (sigma-70 family)